MHPLQPSPDLSGSEVMCAHIGPGSPCLHLVPTNLVEAEKGTWKDCLWMIRKLVRTFPIASKKVKKGEKTTTLELSHFFPSY